MTQRDIAALQAFQKWFLSPAGPGLLHIPLYQPTCHENGISAVTLYRRNGYQAELCILPQGKKYEISLPENTCALTIFLGGSFEYLITNVPDSLKHIRNVAMDEPFRSDDFIETTPSDSQNPDMLEKAHPIISSARHSPYTQPFEGGHMATFSALQGSAVILLFSFYTNEDSIISGLKFVRLAS